MNTLYLPTAPQPEQAVPCCVTQLSQWHEYHARRHRAHLPVDEPAVVTASHAWHRSWAEWHEKQANS